MSVGNGTAAAVLVAAAVVVALTRPKPAAPGVPRSVEAIIRRHVSPGDFDGFADAVRAHVAAGRPLTRAALAALGSVWFEPSAVAAIKRELKAAGY